MIIDTLAIGTMTMILTQLLKRALPGNGWGPSTVVAVSLVATLAYIVSQPNLPTRVDFFYIMNAWAQIALTAIGQYSVATMATDGDGLLSKVVKPKRTPQAIPVDPTPSWLPKE